MSTRLSALAARDQAFLERASVLATPDTDTFLRVVALLSRYQPDPAGDEFAPELRRRLEDLLAQWGHTPETARKKACTHWQDPQTIAAFLSQERRSRMQSAPVGSGADAFAES